MKVESKWSGELPSGIWRSFTVELDKDDLIRILADWELDIEPLKMREIDVFQILENEAERFVCAKLMTYAVLEAKEKLEELNIVKKKLKERISGVQRAGSAEEK